MLKDHLREFEKKCNQDSALHRNSLALNDFLEWFSFGIYFVRFSITYVRHWLPFEKQQVFLPVLLRTYVRNCLPYGKTKAFWSVLWGVRKIILSPILNRYPAHSKLLLVLGQFKIPTWPIQNSYLVNSKPLLGQFWNIEGPRKAILGQMQNSYLANFKTPIWPIQNPDLVN